MPSARTRISAYAQNSPEQRADDIYRENRELEKREAEQSAVLRNGSRSAPPSAQNRTMGKSTPEKWAEMFPGSGNQPAPNATLPQGSPAATSARPSISAYSSPTQEAGQNHESWMGREGVANPPPMMHSGVPGSEGAVLPSNAANYKGISAYNDPDAGGARVIEYDPSKDMRYSKMGVTSGANTAQGIQDKYQTPGTTAKFTPGTVTDNNGNVMNQGGDVWNRDAARAQLYQAHPEVWQAGSEKNKAFADYAAQHGEQAAHANIDTILGGATQANKPNSTTPMPAPGPKTSGLDANQINAYA